METNLATAFILMAKFIERILPLGSVFAGVTLAVAFIESGREASRPRNLVVNLLTGASVSLICAMCASVFYVYRIGVANGMSMIWKDRLLQFEIERPDSATMLRWLEDGSGLYFLYMVSAVGAAIGVLLVLVAIGVSGFTRSGIQGRITSAFASIGFLVLVACAIAEMR